MKYIFTIFILVFASIALSQSSKKPNDEVWITIFEDKEASHLIEKTTMKKDKGVIFFSHMIIFKNPVDVNGEKITKIVSLTAVHCEYRLTKIISDYIFSGNKIIAKDFLSKEDSPSEPKEGTIHHLIMTNLCGAPKNLI